MDQVKIFDTTLRDGEQSPGCSMNLKEKIEVARCLEKLKVDVIEPALQSFPPAISNPLKRSLRQSKTAPSPPLRARR